MPDTDARLTELEIAVTHQAAMLEDLSTVLREQADRIARLERLIGEIAGRLPESAAPDANVRPPHW